ncbi:MFS transporter [Streptomyces clavuligerus]|nr:MFS transporter [Streptomyces clavuligerus]MBY6304605.1 MFS transporter [Streptomyces clavuligerus]QPJ96670.1 MFS transporter [Streptomyces clavuligerus]QPL66649.1 MFS transporter [Streptomyces clavuligerus]QPL72679.1 MFS transporter [Streptomyces clavuligerus]
MASARSAPVLGLTAEGPVFLPGFPGFPGPPGNGDRNGNRDGGGRGRGNGNGPGKGNRRPRRPPGPYTRLLAPPGVRAFVAGGLLARLPMGMFGVSAVVMIATTRGSYALAGAVVATGLAATALLAPWTARLVDRHGQARIAVPAAALAVLGSLALVLCVRLGLPDWTLFAAHAATATTPNTGGMSRARWVHLHRDDPAARHTANSFEQVVDELCFMLGPVLAALLCSALAPHAGTLVAAGLLLTGVLVFAAQRATEPPPAPRRAGGRAPLRTGGMPPLLAVFLTTGVIFGSLEVSTIALLDGPGAGLVLGLQAAGSAVCGLLYGTVRAARDPHRRLVVCLAALCALLVPPPLVALGDGPVPALAAALLAVGAATAPTMVTGLTLVQRLTPPARLNEGMTLAVTAVLIGIAAGSAAGGWTAEHLGPEYGYVLPALAAALGCAVARFAPTRTAGAAAGRDRGQA